MPKKFTGLDKSFETKCYEKQRNAEMVRKFLHFLFVRKYGIIYDGLMEKKYG